MNWSNEDIKFVEKAIEIRNKGFYLDGGQLTEVYNRVLNKRAASTSCGSCIRQRINELEGALNQFKRLSDAAKATQDATHLEKASEALDKQEVDNVPQEENKAVRKAGKGKK